MKCFFKILAISLALLLAFSCSQRPAKIIDHSRSHYSKSSGLNKARYDKRGKRKREIEIKYGDSLYKIAKRYNISMRELINENNLKPPYHLRMGKSLIIPTPEYHIVKKGDSIYKISRRYNMQMNNIISMNNLKAPYELSEGQKLKIHRFNKGNYVVTKAKPKISRNTYSRSKTKNNTTKVSRKTSSRYAGKFSWPTKGKVISQFGPKTGGQYNDGINIKAKQGSVVRAAKDGTVAYVGNELKGYGNLIIVKHSSGWITAYAHLKNSLVKRGQKVQRGEAIGSVGMTGNVKSPQLYFGLRKGRDALNPRNYL